MPRVRPALAFLAGVALVAAGTARSQPGGFVGPAPPTPTPLAAVLLNGIDDPAVVAELKLTDEQVAALVARRQAVWDEAYTTAPARADFAARVAATDAALKKTLTPEQYKRATQLGGQRVVGGPGGVGAKGKAGGPPTLTLRMTAATLKGYPELAAVAKLTDAQQKTLADSLNKGKGGFPVFAAIGLAPDQQASVREFLGPVLSTRWVAKFDPRLSAIPNQPAAIGLLESKDVRADVALTADQDKAVAAVRGKWAKLNTDRTTDLSPKEALAVGTALLAETETALAATLNPGQATRLKQIDRQANGRFRWVAETHVEDFYKIPAGVTEFAVTDEQVKAIDGVWAAYREAAAKVIEAGEPVAVIETKLKELADTRRARAAAVLTPAQDAKVREAFGAPFSGSTVPDSARGPGWNLEDMRAATFGTYSDEVAQLAGSAAIQTELRLTPDQVKQAQATRAELQTKYRTAGPFVADVKTTAAQSAAVEAELKKLLAPDQARRFREIMLQAAERAAAGVSRRGGVSVSVLSAVAYPGVAEAVGLTGEQKKMLLTGAAPGEVLTAGQKAAITKMLGAPFDFPTPEAFTPPASPYLSLLNRPSGVAVSALGLTPEQAAAVAAARDTFQSTVFTALPTFGGGGGGIDYEAYLKVMTPAVGAFDAAVAKTLTPAQRKRVPQVAHQLTAATDLEAALTAPDVAKALALTAAQKARLAALTDEAEGVQTMVSTYRADTPDQALGLRLRDAADERLLAVLTDVQRAAWRDLTGEPVPGLRKTIPGRFGPGGFGGQGGGGFFPGGGFGGGPGVPF